MRPLLLLPLALLAAATLAPPAAPSVPLALHEACADAPAPVLFAQWPTRLENLAFDGAGRLYVSDLGGDRLLRYLPDGALDLVVDVPGMHGVTIGPDGLVYVGAAPLDGEGAGPAQVWRFTDTDLSSHGVVAEGLPAANGLAFDAGGNLFVTNPLGTRPPYLVRAPADDLAAWAPWGDEYGPNGLWLDADGAHLLAAVTGDQSSPILRISTTDPEDVETVARLTLGAATLQPGVHAPAGDFRALPKGLDDLTLGADGRIYAAAHVTGELLRVDLATGDSCAYASGFEEPTSVRVAHGFGAWDGWLFVTDMGGIGVSALFGPGAGAVWALPPATA